MRALALRGLQIAVFVFAFSLEMRVRAETGHEPSLSEKVHAGKNSSDHDDHSSTASSAKNDARHDLASSTKATRPMQLPLAHEAHQQPDECLRGADSCAVRTGPGHRFVLKLGKGFCVLDENSVVIRESNALVRLVEGQIWVSAVDEAIVVRTEFGETEVRTGEAWVDRDSGQMRVTAVDVPLSLRPRGSSEITLALEPGLTSWLGRVGKDGIATMGTVTPIPFSTHVARWARLYPGKKSQFLEKAKEFHAVWVKATKEVAEQHQARFERKVASLQAEEAKRVEEQRKVETRNRELNDLLRRKSFEGL